MIVEGAWVLVVAVVVLAAVIAVVLVGSGKLYNPDRSHE
jgi:archaellin